MTAASTDCSLTLSWRTPQLLVAAVAGYASLGFAYHTGVMAAIDKVAINILIKQVGYIGLGAAMPAFQWYAAWGVRIVACIVAAALYELCVRIAAYCVNHQCWKKA
jgi:hypothetical protein